MVEVLNLIVLLISSITLFVGYALGKKEGLSSGYTKGIYEGAEETLKLIEKYSNSGLKSTFKHKKPYLLV
jgi:hypothetical protein